MISKHKNNRGFTLIEIITVIVVLGVLSVFTFSFIENAIKTYTIGKKQRMLYQEASYIMERISREVRDAQVLTRSTSNNSVYFRTGGLSTTNPLDTNLAVIFLRDSSNNLYRFSSKTFSGFWNPVLSPNNIIGKNVNRFETSFVSVSPHLNDRVSITLELTDPQNTTIKVTLQETISPKNLEHCACSAIPPNYPFVGCLCSFAPDYTNRSFNGDYEDVVQ